MPQPSLLRTTLLAAPLPLADALERLARAEIPEATKPAVRSTAISAVRQALRQGDVLPSKEAALAADIRDLIPILHIAAGEYARTAGHRHPNEHVARAHRFVEVLTGRRFDTPRLDYPCPAVWQPLVDASAGNNANGELGFLARCCLMAGVQNAPQHLPSYDALLAAARASSGEKGKRRLTTALAMYRTTRQRLMDGATPEDRRALELRFAPMPRGRNARTSHLAVETETLECLRGLGHVPEAMTAEAMFRVLAPSLAADFDYWTTEGSGQQQSESYVEQCMATLLRVAGWAVRAGKLAELRSMTSLLDLFLTTEHSPSAVRLNGRVARVVGANSPEDQTLVISLLEYFVEQEAEASLQRSTIVNGDERDAKGRPFLTHALWQNCSRIWDMTQGIYREMSSQGDVHAAKWGLVESRWSRLQHQLSSRQVPAEERLTVKDKLRLIRTVTLPQLVCVALPMRRREAHALRAQWLAAVARAQAAGYRPEQHPAVREAADAYFDKAAVPLTALSLALDDGLRRQQYMRGRLGNQRNFRLVLARDEAGRAIGITSLTTTWSGRRDDPAHLKIREKHGVLQERVARIVRPGYVDLTILWDVVSWWRPMQLVAAGEYASLADYDLDADLREGRFALFPSSVAGVVERRPERSRTDISTMIGRELHYIVRSCLRPHLPAWDDLDASWRALWAAHILRLLTSTYWGGVRGRWDIAMDLTLDTEATLREAYTTLDKRIADLRGGTPNHWEHPKAFDSWMDRLFENMEVFDPLSDPNLPLPPHLIAVVRSAPGLRVAPRPCGAKLRIRAARPGHLRPAPKARAKR